MVVLPRTQLVLRGVLNIETVAGPTKHLAVEKKHSDDSKDHIHSLETALGVVDI